MTYKSAHDEEKGGTIYLKSISKFLEMYSLNK